MKTRFSPICLLGVLLFFLHLRALPAAAQIQADSAQQTDGIVAYCFDGDTVKLKDRRVVRMAGIDAPELAHNGKNAQFYSHAARKALENLVLGKKIRLQFPGTSIKDRHGRLIANILLEDGTSVNALMVEQGAAFFYPHQDLGPEFQENLRSLQAEAIGERRGMWERLLAMPLAQYHYLGNKASLRFFPVDCREAQQIRPRNRAPFGNLMDAFLAGYAPARICIFWPAE